MTPESPEVRWRASTAAFEEDEITEHLADQLALGAEVLLFALVVVVLTLLVWGAM